jgi:hypothetical protein
MALNCGPNWTTLTTMSNENKNYFMSTGNVIILGQVVITFYSFVLTCFVFGSWPQGNAFYILSFSTLDLLEEIFIFRILIA